MDLVNLLKKVNNISEYIAVTENSLEKCKISRIQLNMSNVLALSKIRSFEIEYINKCEQNGIACIIFERILCLPPSKTWEVLSMEMVNILKYWLDAIRKHLVKHSSYWWIFLKLLLKFTRDIQNKSATIPNVLAEHISECLLDLATAERPDAMQRYEILHCFNLFCCESSREARLALRNKFEQYFTKLSVYMCTCGHLPTQYSIMETLMRWLVPRRDRNLRVTSAIKWFPTKLYAESTVDIFLERSWINFYQDARDFLNTHNTRSDIITSVVCTKLSVGGAVVISDKQYTESWLDVNCTTNCISVLLDLKALAAFESTTSYKSFETLVLTDDNISTAKFYKENEQLVLFIHTLSPPCILPSCVQLGEGGVNDVTAIVTSHCDHKRLDAALRRILDYKYQLLIDLEELTLIPTNLPEATSYNGSEVNTTLSNIEKKLPKRSGVKLRIPVSCMSPSTTSTTSLAQLHEKLAELPRYKFVKEAKSVCANPKLSVVTEVSETDDRSTSALRYKRFGTCAVKKSTNRERVCQSDNESIRRNFGFSKRVKDRKVSSISNYNPTSSLLVATIGSADETVINDTAESISKSHLFKGNNIIDILMHEVSNAQLDKEKANCNNTAKEKSQHVIKSCDVIENTQNIEIDRDKGKDSNANSFELSEESNTEAISDTPNIYVSTRRKNKDSHKVVALEETLNDNIVDEFFAQHCIESRVAGNISPTLARKINETSSESTPELFDNNLILLSNNLQDVELVEFEVLECLTSMVDQVCADLDKCTQYFNNEYNPSAESETDVEDNIPLQGIINARKNIDITNKQSTSKNITKKNIKLKYKITPKMNKTKSRDNKNKSKITAIIENNVNVGKETSLPLTKIEQNVTIVDNNLISGNVIQTKTPLRKKRKLFSPKDEDFNKVVSTNLEHQEFDAQANETPKSSSIYKVYKEKELVQKHIRLPRNRKSRTIITTSPRTKKLDDLFQKVKDSTDREQVAVVKNTTKFDVYNFSSDSEADFKIEKYAFTKRNATTNLNKDSINLRREKHSKLVNRSNKGVSKTKRNVSKQKTKKKMSDKRELNHKLVDERMRNSKTEMLNTSLIIQQSKAALPEPDPLIAKVPEIEIIPDKSDYLNENQQKTKVTKTNKVRNVDSGKALGKILNNISNLDEDRTLSPLPELVIEVDSNNKRNEDLSVDMIEKFKEICNNPKHYFDVPNTTQNLLSDNEITIHAPQLYDVITHKIQKKAQFKSTLNTSESKKVSKTSNQKEMNEYVDVIKVSRSIESKAKSRKRSKSDQSIPTLCITGHGDSEEGPPSPALIEQRLVHRNLETDYLNDSMRNYVERAREEINGMLIKSNRSNKSNMTVSSPNKSDIQTYHVINRSATSPISLPSPVVSLKRISMKDIARYMPSNRNSEWSSESEISNNSRKNKKALQEIRESPKNPTSPQTDDAAEDPKLQEPIRRFLHSIEIPPTKKQSLTDKDIAVNVSDSKNTKTKQKPRVQPTRKVKYTQRSFISPIKLFDDSKSNVDKTSNATMSEDRDFTNSQKTNTQTERNLQKTITQTQSTDEQKSNNERKSDQQYKKRTINKLPVPSIASGSNSKIDSSTTVDDCTLKRRMNQDVDSYKKRKIEEDVCRSLKTVSSLDDWFSKVQSDEITNKHHQTSDSLRDNIQNVMEKLDTTLVEIHQNTSNHLAQLLLKSQQRWCQLNEDRYEMFGTVAREIMVSVANVIEEKFCDMDKKSKQQGKEFMDHLRKHSLEFIKKDCEQKRLMVQLLREDMEAVLKHNN